MDGKIRHKQWLMTIYLIVNKKKQLIQKLLLIFNCFIFLQRLEVKQHFPQRRLVCKNRRFRSGDRESAMVRWVSQFVINILLQGFFCGLLKLYKLLKHECKYHIDVLSTMVAICHILKSRFGGIFEYCSFFLYFSKNSPILVLIFHLVIRVFIPPMTWKKSAVGGGRTVAATNGVHPQF